MSESKTVGFLTFVRMSSLLSDARLRRVFANRFRSAEYGNLKRSAALQIPIFPNITLLTVFDNVSSDRLGLRLLVSPSHLQHMAALK